MRRALGAVLVAAVALAVPGCSDSGDERGDQMSARPELVQAGPIPAGTDCSREPLPFRATVLPDGWNPELEIGELRDYKEDRSYTSETTKSWKGPGKEAIAVYRDPPGIEPPEQPAPMEVLGGRGVIGPYPLGEFGSDGPPVTSAAFSWCGSHWALVGVGGVTLEQVRRAAEGLAPA